ncbi:hypothetical protein [Zemynaea arenosa]|nr:hypothetical protein [Massilia arenosa]
MFDKLLRHIFEPEERERTMRAIGIFMVVGGTLVSALLIGAIIMR